MKAICYQTIQRPCLPRASTFHDIISKNFPIHLNATWYGCESEGPGSLAVASGTTRSMATARQKKIINEKFALVKLFLSLPLEMCVCFQWLLG